MGLTRAFATYLSKKINEHFPPSEKSGEPTAEPEALYVALNAVKDPSFVRVEAGELKERSGPFFLLLFFFSRRFFFFSWRKKSEKTSPFLSLSAPPAFPLSSKTKTPDELSYSLHVVLRVEIEAALLRGEIEVDDVPRVWDEKMRASLGCSPPSDDGRVNCLQDM